MTAELYERVFMWFACALYIGFTIIRRRSAKRTRAAKSPVVYQESKKGVDFLRYLILYEVVTFVLYIVNATSFPETMILQLPFPYWLRWIGVGLFAAADLLFFFVHRHLGANFYSNLRIRREHELVTTGPYRRIRHPMYTAFYLNHFGMFFLTANLFIGVTWIAAFSMIMMYRIGREEKMMIAEFGGLYQSYALRTGRFLPRIITGNGVRKSYGH